MPSQDDEEGVVVVLFDGRLGIERCSIEWSGDGFGNCSFGCGGCLNSYLRYLDAGPGCRERDASVASSLGTSS